jgi:hypothetical protein
MCHLSVGLVANTLERHLLTTMLITVKPDVTLGTGAPRAMYIRFPMGNPCGEPDKPAEQRRILLYALELVEKLREPGSMIHVPYRWRRMKV